MYQSTPVDSMKGAITTPLHEAARLGLSDVVEGLIADGVDVNARDASGCTALHLSIQEGHLQVRGPS